VSGERPIKINWGDIAWVLVMGAQGGLMLATPVLAGLALGYWLDTTLNTLPWITLVLALLGTVTGPFLLYRWVMSVVKRRISKQEERQEESGPEERDS